MLQAFGSDAEALHVWAELSQSTWQIAIVSLFNISSLCAASRSGHRARSRNNTVLLGSFFCILMTQSTQLRGISRYRFPRQSPPDTTLSQPLQTNMRPRDSSRERLCLWYASLEVEQQPGGFLESSTRSPIDRHIWVYCHVGQDPRCTAIRAPAVEVARRPSNVRTRRLRCAMKRPCIYELALSLRFIHSFATGRSGMAESSHAALHEVPR